MANLHTNGEPKAKPLRTRVEENKKKIKKKVGTNTNINKRK